MIGKNYNYILRLNLSRKVVCIFISHQVNYAVCIIARLAIVLKLDC